MSDSNISANARKPDGLSQAASIRRLWWAFALILAISVLTQFAVDMHPHFGPDGWFGFNAAFGFLTCVAMVLFAKVLGWALKRREDYYAAATARSESDDHV